MIPNNDLNRMLAYIRGELPAVEAQKLEARFLTDPELARRLMQIALNEVALADWAQIEHRVKKIELANARLHPASSAASTSDSPVLASAIPLAAIPVTTLPLPQGFTPLIETTIPLGIGNSDVSAPVPAPVGWVSLPPSGLWSWFLLALGVTCSLLLGFWLWPNNNLGRGEVIAKIQGIQYVQWRKANANIQVGSNICEGYDFDLIAGKIDIVYPHGATLQITGPAKWKMVSLDSSLLESGKLTAYVPPAALGYRVQTPVVSVLDKGTRFGVQVNAEIGTEVHVFDGEVETQSLRGKQSPQPIHMTQAVRYDSIGNLKEWIPPAYETFQSTNLVLGIIRTSQNIRWTSKPPSSLEQNRFTSDDNMLLILERENIALRGPIATTFMMPGRGTRSAYDKNIAMLPKGVRVDSYLLHYNSAGRKKPVHGDIQFTRPIVAVIARGDQLIWTDHLLGRPEITYERNKEIRGLKGGSPETPAPDVLNLGLGPNRLNLWCEAGRNTVAELRILVEAAPASDNIDGEKMPKNGEEL